MSVGACYECRYGSLSLGREERLQTGSALLGAEAVRKMLSASASFLLGERLASPEETALCGWTSCRAAAGWQPAVWYVDAEPRGLPPAAAQRRCSRQPHSLTQARNKALEDSMAENKACVQISDDISHADRDSMNKEFKATSALHLTPLAAAVPAPWHDARN